jgi:thiamine biosynthesis protein ThiI
VIGAPSYVVHYPELALKGRKRPWFVDTLLRHMRRVLAPLGVREVRAIAGRVEVVLRSGAEDAAIVERLRHTFGVANFGRALRCEPALDDILETVVASLGPGEVPSFRVRARRADKRFPVSSPEIERLAGERIIAARGWPVDLRHPALTVFVEVVKGAAFCLNSRGTGPGGLPIGASGTAVCLLSGGIDSPVAAWRMMRRGCRVVGVHFHSQPFTSVASQDAVHDVARVLSRYQGTMRVTSVPLAEVQRHIVSVAPPAFRTVAYRRFMIRIAERIARRVHARALVTGDAVGQVASQTLDNLAVVDAVATMPVLRPLVGFSKEEIIDEARRIGTHPFYVPPEDDCCQLFSPRRVATDATRQEVDAIDQRLDVDALVSGAVRAAAFESVGPTWGAEPEAGPDEQSS